MGEPGNGYDSSSGEEDGDARWRAAIESVAGTTSYISSFMNGSSSASKEKSRAKPSDDDDDGQRKPKTQQMKHYQVKAQRLLDDIIENTLEIVKEPMPILDEDPKIQEGGVRLFKHAQPGIVFDHVDEPEPPRKRPRILPGEDIDEKSKKFKRQVRSVAVNGRDIMASAEDAYQKALARLEARDAAAKAAAQREKERVENLKKVRGERWLPSMARDMQLGYKH
ncbi:uncharacterized protein LOC114731336 [Neltuma alba]|uniref:uncharacterized protein LOC114731336 n=1 Tax=Neltuma alba TaxID=207710 RepID=UPI0010A366F0|nr:uncharacterized protein LOC114729960 isoform X2 [Prosopis alba]XP_028774306.1 uncharacterized protein LOC114731331 isoform X2 [Prosopis alba]XP_028774312.1 uncharacterized protein LOC114731336 [Prosopis alba]